MLLIVLFIIQLTDSKAQKSIDELAKECDNGNKSSCTKLINYAKYDLNVDVQKAAIRKIKNQGVLMDIATTDDSPEIAFYALTNVTNINITKFEQIKYNIIYKHLNMCKGGIYDLLLLNYDPYLKKCFRQFKLSITPEIKIAKYESDYELHIINYYVKIVIDSIPIFSKLFTTFYERNRIPSERFFNTKTENVYAYVDHDTIGKAILSKIQDKELKIKFFKSIYYLSFYEQCKSLRRENEPSLDYDIYDILGLLIVDDIPDQQTLKDISINSLNVLISKTAIININDFGMLNITSKTAKLDDVREYAKIRYRQLEIITSIKSSLFKDLRDEKAYKSITIGSQTMMAENLAYKPDIGSFWAYANNNRNILKYGYLYDYRTAQTVCPTGWHLPSETEWNNLANYLEINNDREYTGRSEPKTLLSLGNNNLNIYGFEASMSGQRNSWDSSFAEIGANAYFWSSSNIDNDRGWSLNFKESRLSAMYKKAGLSVRCFKD